MSHTRCVSTFAALTSALMAAGCSAKSPELPTLSELSLSKLNPFGASTPPKTEAKPFASLSDEPVSVYAHIPGRNTYLSTLTTERDIARAQSVCANLGLTDTRKVGEAMVALARIDENHRTITSTAEKCRLAGAHPLAHNTQASSSAAFRAEDTDRPL